MEKKLYRTVVDRKFCGVCGGIGCYLNVDPSMIRVIWAIATLCSVGLGLLAYLACALIIPEEPRQIEQ